MVCNRMMNSRTVPMPITLWRGRKFLGAVDAKHRNCLARDETGGVDEGGGGGTRGATVGK